MKDNSIHLVKNYDDIVEEQWYLSKELVDMDKSALIEETIYALEFYDFKSVERIVRDYFLNKKLNCNSIIKIEAFYRLVWSHFFWRE